MAPVATCSICFEDLIVHTPAVSRKNGQAHGASSSSLSAAPCGHVFHTRCVAKWLEGGDSRGDCPQCRRPAETLVRLFLAGDDQVGGDGHYSSINDGAVGPRRDVAVMEDKLQMSQREVEESRIIQVRSNQILLLSKS